MDQFGRPEWVLLGFPDERIITYEGIVDHYFCRPAPGLFAVAWAPMFSRGYCIGVVNDVRLDRDEHIDEVVRTTLGKHYPHCESMLQVAGIIHALAAESLAEDSDDK